MSYVDLRTTGVAQIDQTMTGLVDLMELVFAVWSKSATTMQ
ncbi:MAG: hypothetical protein GFH27_549305n205 [Chloroflexi bacterium AL-W]|nr:hypothetical protein [Chloroflexi bacterium AL-N1]NOK71223.1 hypothetical protein [Chloroflexi bacterium AL-N10]NOK76512.1 hypothetical protein [Chloroflexi bacterium AL-N5]NOK83629.1 hypothetical protein [Chloroflexi bacterium AL-W]NOK92249.1 hypothetical protein [Chloroflexi bacterium AL-N15]